MEYFDNAEFVHCANRFEIHFVQFDIGGEFSNSHCNNVLKNPDRLFPRRDVVSSKRKLQTIPGLSTLIIFADGLVKFKYIV